MIIHEYDLYTSIEFNLLPSRIGWGDRLSYKRRRRKRKQYLPVIAPPILGGAELPEIVTGDPEKVIGRTYPILLYDLTNDPSHQFIKCKLKITDVKDGKAYSIYAGHEYLREYIRSLIIRGTSYIDIYKDITTKDNYTYRLLVGIYTPRRVNTSRKKAIRREVFKVMDGWKNMSNDTFIREAIFGVLDVGIVKAAKKIYPVRWGGIQKIKLISLPH